MRYSCYILLCCALLTGACQKLETESPKFSATITSPSYKLGDTVAFRFSGNPDNITFFSGENGNNYAHRDRTSAEGTPQLQFTSFMQYGTQQNTLRLLASTNFNGTFDSTNVVNATWTDITDKATLSTGADNTPSGIVDLSSVAVKDKPLYLAFKYVGFKSSTSAQRTWTIKNFQVNNLLADGNLLPVASMADAGFLALSLKNPAAKWTISATQIQMAGGAVNTSLDNEDWIITKALNLTKVAPDAGLALKDMTTRMDQYTYVYKKAGTYKATFVASNASAKGFKTVLQDLDITITP